MYLSLKFLIWKEISRGAPKETDLCKELGVSKVPKNVRKNVKNMILVTALHPKLEKFVVKKIYVF